MPLSCHSSNSTRTAAGAADDSRGSQLPLATNAVARVEERRPPLGLEVERILRQVVLAGQGLGRRAAQVHRRQVVHRLRQPVRHVEAHRVAEPARHAELPRVVPRPGHASQHRDRGEVARAAVGRAVGVDPAPVGVLRRGPGADRRPGSPRRCAAGCRPPRPRSATSTRYLSKSDRCTPMFQFWTCGGFASTSSANCVPGRTNVSGRRERPALERVLEVEPGAAQLHELRGGRRADRHLRRGARAVLELVVEQAVAAPHGPDARAGRVPRQPRARHEGVGALRDPAAHAGVAREEEAHRGIGPDLRLARPARTR